MPRENLTKLQLYLKANNLTQTDLYNLIDAEYDKPVGMDRISKFSSGGDVMMSTILKMCVVLGCTPNDIINYEDYTETEEV